MDARRFYGKNKVVIPPLSQTDSDDGLDSSDYDDNDPISTQSDSNSESSSSESGKRIMQLYVICFT